MSNISQKPLRNRVLRALRALSAAALVLAFTGLLWVTPGRAAIPVTCVNCSNVWTQGMAYAQTIEMAVNATQTVMNLAQLGITTDNQLRVMERNAQGWNDNMFRSISGQMQLVIDAYKNAQSLGRNVATSDQQFRQKFKGYEDYLQSTGAASSVMPDRYERWAKQGLDNARTAMQAAGINIGSLKDEDQMLGLLVTRSTDAVGQLQAVMAGNEIAAHTVQQLQKLRDMVATQITMQINYLAQQTERKAVDDAFRQKFRAVQVRGSGADKEY